VCLSLDGEEGRDPVRVGFLNPDTPGVFEGAVVDCHVDGGASKNTLDVSGNFCRRRAVGQKPRSV